MKKGTLILTVALMLVAVSIVSAQGSFPDPGVSETNAILQNLATGSGETATVAIDYYNQSGSLVYTNSTITIPPKSVVEVKTADENLPSGFQGAAVISSDRPLAAVELQDRRPALEELGRVRHRWRAEYGFRLHHVRRGGE